LIELLENKKINLLLNNFILITSTSDSRSSGFPTPVNNSRRLKQ